MKHSIDKSLTRSLASESLAHSLATVADTALDAAIDSGALDGVPVIGILTGTMKAMRDMRETLFLRKIVLFLKQLSSVPIEERKRFVEQFEDEDERHKFGEAIMLIIERAEDMEKPKIVGRIVAAHILGHINHEVAMRLAKMVDRSYFEDLKYLKSFSHGTQGQMTPIAESLFSAGFLSNCGFNGGNAAGEGSGVVYGMNEYGRLLVTHGLT